MSVKEVFQPAGEVVQPAVQVPEPAEPIAEGPTSPDPEDLPDEPADEEPDELEDDEWEEMEDEADDVDEPDDEPGPIAADQEPALPLAPGPILMASPVPPPPQDIEADISGDEVVMQLGHRRYRVRGLSKNMAFDQMKVNVLASTEKGMFVDTFDLYIAGTAGNSSCKRPLNWVSKSRPSRRTWAGCC